MVFVAGKHINNINEFSPDFHIIIQLIKEGSDWLKWALTDPSLSVYYAESEPDLLKKIQSGLHETTLLKTNAFNLDIEKAMSLEDPDMELLLSAFQTGATQSAAVKSLLKRYGLVTNAQLRLNSAFLTNNGLTDLPVFQGISFKDHLELFAFRKGLSKSKLTDEALTFAQAKAATSSEFVHYAQFYLNCAAHQLPANTDPNLRTQQVEDIFNLLSEVCFSLIYVPNIGSFDSTDQMADHLKDFVVTSKFIGYRLKATAMENLARNVEILGSDLDSLKVNIESYMHDIKTKVAGGEFTAGPSPQDGWLNTFTLTDDGFEVIIQVDSTGDVFLSPKTGPNQ